MLFFAHDTNSRFATPRCCPPPAARSLGSLLPLTMDTARWRHSPTKPPPSGDVGRGDGGWGFPSPPLNVGETVSSSSGVVARRRSGGVGGVTGVPGLDGVVGSQDSGINLGRPDRATLTPTLFARIISGSLETGLGRLCIKCCGASSPIPASSSLSSSWVSSGVTGRIKVSTLNDLAKLPGAGRLEAEDCAAVIDSTLSEPVLSHLARRHATLPAKYMWGDSMQTPVEVGLGGGCCCTCIGMEILPQHRHGNIDTVHSIPTPICFASLLSVS